MSKKQSGAKGKRKPSPAPTTPPPLPPEVLAQALYEVFILERGKR